MSDLFELRQKVEEGAKWRGSINVVIDDDSYELNVRQLRDPEFWEVMSQVDEDEIEDLQNKLSEELGEEKMEELQELRDKEDLTDDEEEKLQAMQTEMENQDINLFDTISLDTFNGLRQAAKYGVEPDQQDIQRILTQHGAEVDEMYGRATEDEARRWYNENELPALIDRCTNFVSFTIGIQVLGEAIGDTGN